MRRGDARSGPCEYASSTDRCDLDVALICVLHPAPRQRSVALVRSQLTRPPESAH